MLESVLAANPDGCTVNPKTFDLVSKSRGYFVALTDNEITTEYVAETKKLWQLADVLRLSDFFLGYWRDERTGKEFLDLSVHVMNRQTALALARLHNQKAIWDCKNSDCIYLN